MTVLGSDSGRQKTGCAHAGSCGSAAKAQPPAGPARRIGALGPGGGHLMRLVVFAPVVRISAEEFPGQVGCGTSAERLVAFVGTPRLVTHGAPSSVESAPPQRGSLTNPNRR